MKSMKKSILGVIASVAFVASMAIPASLASADDVPLEVNADCTGVLAWGDAPQGTAVSFNFVVAAPADTPSLTETSNDFANFSVEDQTCLPRNGWTVTSSLTALTNGSYYLEADLTIQTMVAVDMGVVWVNGQWNSGYTFVYAGDHTLGSYAVPPQVAQTPPSPTFDETEDGRGTTTFIAPPYGGYLPISITINDVLTVADGLYEGDLTFTLAPKGP